jgi:FSR family fosmidomycin resistance protein-like MFS transporter
LADELVDGVKGAALPFIRHDLRLSYGQVGLLASLPLLVGGVLELPLGILADDPRRRRRVVLGGGILFVLSLLAVASARSFAVLLCAFVAFYPFSGAYVSLTQAELMDAWPDRQARVMARWDLAGAIGAVAGPLLLMVVLACGGGWRDGYLILAGFAAVTWLGTCLREPLPGRAQAPRPDGEEDGRGRGGSDDGEEDGGTPGGTGDDGGGGGSGGDGSGGGNGDDQGGGGAAERSAGEWVREVLAALRDWGTVRWLVLLQVADLLVDALTGFLALYLVDVAHVTPTVAALAIAIRLGAGLGGDAVLVVVLERVGDVAVLRGTAIAAGLLYPAFLLVPGTVAKLVILAALSAATAPWYPLLQARLYGRLPGRGSVAVTLGTAAGLAGGLGPLAVGLAAQHLGLAWALAGLALVPVAVLAGCVTARGGDHADPRTGEGGGTTARSG